MIELADLKAACNAVLRRCYPAYSIYGSDSTEGLDRPGFYTEIIPYYFKYSSKNYADCSAGYKITFLEETPDEVAQLTLVAELRKAFGMTVRVAGRPLLVGQISHDYAGQNNDILQITISFEWVDIMTREEPEEIMQDVDIQYTQKGD